MSDFLFNVRSVLGKDIYLGKIYWDFIIKFKHPSMEGKDKQIVETLCDAEEVRQSVNDRQVNLYYKRFQKYWICVIVKNQNGKGFIITSYLTDRIKEGERIWKKQ